MKSHIRQRDRAKVRGRNAQRGVVGLITLMAFTFMAKGAIETVRNRIKSRQTDRSHGGGEYEEMIGI